MQLPEIFKAQFDDLLKKSEQKKFFAALDEPTSTALRYHPQKLVARMEGVAIPWSEYGITLSERPSFTDDPVFHGGAYYVQDASTQLLEYAVREIQKEQKVTTVLDLCAAPGGKTTHLLSLMEGEAMIVANEVIATRVKILEENVIKWGMPEIVIINKDPKYFSHVPDFFDLIVVDAPCSGEGLFRKDPDAIKEWSPEHVMQCSLRQRRILSDVLPSLKPGGVLLYSTCTYNYLEDEFIVEWLQEEFELEGVPLQAPKEWNLTEYIAGDATCYRTFAHKVSGEGFFMALLRKPLDQRAPKPVRNHKSRFTLKPLSEKEISSWLIDPKKYLLFEEKGEIRAFPKKHFTDFTRFADELWPSSFGVKVAERKGKEVVPTHDIALSPILKKDAFPRCEVDKVTAMQYLKKELEVLPTKENGYILITHEDIPLGFVKKSGMKISNLYPMENRVRR